MKDLKKKFLNNKSIKNIYMIIITIFLFFIIFIILDIQKYVITSNYKTIDKEISFVAKNIKEKIEKIENDAIYYSKLDIFQIENKNIDSQIRFFLEKHANYISKLSVYDSKSANIYSLDKSYRFDKFKVKNYNLEIHKNLEYKKILDDYYLIIPIKDPNGKVNRNIMMKLDIEKIMKESIDEFYVDGEYWTWITNDKNKIIPVGYSETREVNERFHLSNSSEIIKDIENGYKNSINNSIFYGKVETVLTSYYPINYKGHFYAIGASVYKRSLIRDIIYRIIVLILAILLLALVIIILIVNKNNIEKNRIKKLFKNMAFGIVLFDNDKIEVSNKYANEKLLIDSDNFEFDKFYHKIIQIPKHKKEIIKINKNNNERFLLLKRSSLEYNTKDYNLISFMDVTAINKAKKEAEKSSKLKSQFIATVSHEIKTPLNSIIASLELIDSLKKEKNKELNDYLNVMNDSASSLLEMVNDILDISKIESGKLKLEEENINTSEFFQKIYNQFIPLINEKEKDIDYNLKLDSNLPDVLIGDGSKLRQILINLLGNAVKFTEKGKINLKIELINKQDEFVDIKISVLDTGIGIPQDKLDIVFNKFMQVDNSNKRKYEGDGLGTAISKELVELMGGKIKVKSPNPYIESDFPGSVFYFTLKLKYLDKLTKNETKTKVDIKKDFNVLLAEDNLVNAKITRKILEQLGCSVVVAKNGKEAIEKYNNSFNLILMDIQMPKKDGFETSKEILKLNSEAIIYALTANKASNIQKKVDETNMKGIIEKPISKQKIVKILKKENK
ncbi:MAG: ATP-binding protein [Bacillota bacterium]